MGSEAEWELDRAEHAMFSYNRPDNPDAFRRELREARVQDLFDDELVDLLSETEKS